MEFLLIPRAAYPIIVLYAVFFGIALFVVCFLSLSLSLAFLFFSSVEWNINFKILHANFAFRVRDGNVYSNRKKRHLFLSH